MPRTPIQHRFATLALVLCIGLTACGSQVSAASGKPVLRALKPPIPPSRPAPAMVQVENSPGSGPHAGLQKADIVYEYRTEGGITRFTAIYEQPSGPSRVEPVRSTRLITLRLQRAYGGVIFTSGASDHVIGLIYSGGVPFIDDRRDGGHFFQRDRARAAPHNLVTTQDQLQAGVAAWKARVAYPAPVHAEPAAPGDRAGRVAFQQTELHQVVYTYSPQEGAYGYASENGPELDSDNGMQQVKVTNVVLLQVAHHGAGYTEDVLGAEGIDFDLQGGGAADVYTRGSHYAARWDLSHPDQPLKLLRPDGKPMVLPAGPTWIHLVDPGTPVAVS